MSVKMIKPRVGMVKHKDPVKISERTRGRKLQSVRNEIALRDLFVCQSCHKTIANGEVDHIIPLHLGGRDSSHNMQWLCVQCHKEKTTKEGSNRGYGGVISE
jgi:5-methylcytosine-specific restriction protein A